MTALRTFTAGRRIVLCVLAAFGLIAVGASNRHPPPAAAESAAGLLFGLGPELDGARRSPLVTGGGVRMLTSWYNGPDDLRWMTGWRTTEVPRAYQDGFALHLIVWAGDAEGPVDTSNGPACGRRYPLSAGFLDDMRELARTFAGSASGPPLYVTLFTEFQTYPCTDNAWSPNAATQHYLEALKARYSEAMAIFRNTAPNARVSLGWGGWQARWDDPAVGGGRSLFGHFADVMAASDFQSFQAMQSDSNTTDIDAMTQALGRYGPVMLAHYKPDNSSQATFDADVRALLTTDTIDRLRRQGLFALSFMDATNVEASASTLTFVQDAIARLRATSSTTLSPPQPASPTPTTSTGSKRTTTRSTRRAHKASATKVCRRKRTRRTKHRTTVHTTRAASACSRRRVKPKGTKRHATPHRSRAAAR